MKDFLGAACPFCGCEDFRQVDYDSSIDWLQCQRCTLVYEADADDVYALRKRRAPPGAAGAVAR